jgi:hypothetical protein
VEALTTPPEAEAENVEPLLVVLAFALDEMVML